MFVLNQHTLRCRRWHPALAAGIFLQCRDSTCHSQCSLSLLDQGCNTHSLRDAWNPSFESFRMQQITYVPVNLSQHEGRSALRHLFVKFAEHPYSRQVDVRRRREVDDHQFHNALSTRLFQHLVLDILGVEIKQSRFHTQHQHVWKRFSSRDSVQNRQTRRFRAAFPRRRFWGGKLVGAEAE